MIVSGFTQKRSYQVRKLKLGAFVHHKITRMLLKNQVPGVNYDRVMPSFPTGSAAEVEGQHSHCIRCCKVGCTKFADQTTSCEMITCELCGWRCHRCKLNEHILACPEERVACVNKEYGCPHMVKRSRMATHLPVCPASVVCCSEEWSRWPMHNREKGMRLPLPTSKTYIDCGQLDIGLAMRDQRMLIDSLRAPRKLRRTLRNTLTQKYPAAPFTPHGRASEVDPAASSDTSHTVSDDESDAPWDLNKSPPGLRESIKSKLFLVTKETTDNMAELLGRSATAKASSQDRLSEFPSADEVSDHKIKASGLNFRSSSLPPDHTFDSKSSNVSGTNSFADADHIQSGTVASTDITQPALPLGSSASQDPMFSESDTNGHRCGANQESRPALQPGERSARSSLSSDRFSEVSSRSKSTLHDIGGTQLHKILGQEDGVGDGQVGLEEDPSALEEICLHKLLGVNVGFECINKYVYKSPSMYNFICAQNFRRDEYRWHFKNVHQDIHQGSQGWLEQRCPLAYLGCTFSFSRLEPAQPGMEVYHSWLQESFGLRNTAFTASYNEDSAGQSVHDDSLSTGVPDNTSTEAQANQGCRGMEESYGCDARTPSDSHKSTSSLKGSLYSASTDVNTSTGPSISDLGSIDKDFEGSFERSAVSFNYVQGDESSKQFGTIENGKTDMTSDNHPSSRRTEETRSQSQRGEETNGPKLRMRVRPTIYTAMNADSKVLFEYEVEQDEEYKRETLQLNILDLPYELLINIAKHLDSFSLCNLALTSRLLRDVCCSLLDDHGIVLLNWQRHKSGNDITWRVANKRWMFSTSFEPIKSWRFKPNVPHMGDHLKVCPFNQDIQRHSGRVQVMKPGPESDALDQQYSPEA